MRRVSLTLGHIEKIRIEPAPASRRSRAAHWTESDLARRHTAQPAKRGVRILGAIIDTNGGALRILVKGDADNGYASGREDEVDLAGVRIEDSTVIDTGGRETFDHVGAGEGGREGELAGVIEESGAYSNTIEAPGGTVDSLSERSVVPGCSP